MRCAGPGTVSADGDVEPLVAYSDGGQEAGGSSCGAAAGGYLRRLVRPLLYTRADCPSLGGLSGLPGAAAADTARDAARQCHRVLRLLLRLLPAGSASWRASVTFARRLATWPTPCPHPGRPGFSSRARPPRPMARHRGRWSRCATTVVTKALEFTDGSGWPCRSRHRISWRSRRSLPQNVPLSYTGTTGGPTKIIADTNGCMDLPPNPIKSRDGQDPVPILVVGPLARSDLEAGIEALLRSWPGNGPNLSSNGTGQRR